MAFETDTGRAFAKGRLPFADNHRLERTPKISDQMLVSAPLRAKQYPDPWFLEMAGQLRSW